jgi:hypothetical protein
MASSFERFFDLEASLMGLLLFLSDSVVRL